MGNTFQVDKDIPHDSIQNYYLDNSDRNPPKPVEPKKAVERIHHFVFPWTNDIKNPKNNNFEDYWSDYLHPLNFEFHYQQKPRSVSIMRDISIIYFATINIL